jgi:FMN phosphatase YigB (HAD superfamily)
MLDGWEACPAAADPYILASAVASRVLASVGKTSSHGALPGALYGALYGKHAAPFRSEARAVVEALTERHTVAVISNASTGKVEHRLDDLLGARTRPRAAVSVMGNASKFSVRPATDTGPHRAAFDALPTFTAGAGVARPTWLRRGAFFDRLAEAWGADEAGPAHTIFCGDIWELDLALPAALGCAVHLVERKDPLATHEVERLAVAQCPRAGMSAGLDGLLARLS